MLAGILAQAVAPLHLDGQSLDDHVLLPQVDNPGGFNESQNLVQFNEELFAELSIDWQRPPLHPVHWQDPVLFHRLFHSRQRFSHWALSQRWVDKDPRLCITYPAYQHVLLRRVPVAAIFRHPYEVSSSLQNRDGLSLSHGLLIWFLYNQHLSRVLQAQSDLLVGYESILHGDSWVVQRLEAFLGRLDPFHADEESWSPATLKLLLADRVRPEWRRSSDLRPTTPLPQAEWHQLADVCVSCYQNVAAAGFSIEAFRQVFASTPEVVLCSYAVQVWKLPPSPPSMTDLEDQIRQKSRDEILALQRSLSWRMTKPLRWIGGSLKRSPG